MSDVSDHHLPDPLPIASGQGDYAVEFHATPAAAIAAAVEGATAVVADRTVMEAYGSQAADALSAVPVMQIDASEETKTLIGVGETCSWLLSLRANRTSRVVALGGGIVQDVATFAAHVYHRGIRWDFVPTTLLAMSDSCIGAKCGINHDGFKNQLGVFHSPGAVHIAAGFLDTLDDDEVRSGYGEVFKLCLTHGPEAFAQLREALAGGIRNDHLMELIRLSLEAKRAVIEEDEYESDRRRILNYGHTFGHALEAVSGNRISHGLAVIWGCDVINRIAVENGYLSQGAYDEIHAVAQTLMPEGAGVPDFSAAELIDAARTDKKAEGSLVNLAVLFDPGDLRVVQKDFDRDLAPIIAAYLSDDDLLARS